MRTPYPNELMHYGIPGMRKGVRRFQNEDGSLTAAGRDRYGVGQYTDAGTGNPSRSSRPQGRTTHVTGSGSISRRGVASTNGPVSGRGAASWWRPSEADYLRANLTANQKSARNGRKINQQWNEKPISQEHKSRNMYTGNTHRWNNYYGVGSRTVERNGQWVDYMPRRGEATGILSSPSDYKAYSAEKHAQDAWNASQQAARNDSKVARQNARTIRQMQASTAFEKASSAVKSTASSAVKSLTSWASGLFGKKKKG